MEKFVILAVKRSGGEVECLREIFSGEERAVRTCMDIFRKCGMHKVILVDTAITVRFKDTRRCLCMNVQRTMVGMAHGEVIYRDVCTACNCAIDYDAWMEAQGCEIDMKEVDA